MKKPSKTHIKATFTDPSGTPRRVFVPPGETNYSMGIPVSLDIASLYTHMPPDFTRRLTEALHARGLVEPGDYFTPGADQRFKSALMSVIRADFLSIQQLAKQELGK
jgi:hypothetical protein